MLCANLFFHLFGQIGAKPSNDPELNAFHLHLTVGCLFCLVVILFYRSLHLNCGFFSPFVEIQKTAHEQVDPHQVKTGGLHLMLLQMDLLNHLDMGPTVIADGIVTQHRMVM